MPETYTVVAAEHKADKPDTGYGEMQVIALSLKGPDGTIKQAEWFTKKSTSVPSPGVQLVGEIRSGQYGLQFKKVASAASGFGPRPEDPQRKKRIVRQHSQSMALQALALRFSPETFYAMPPDEFTRRLRELADWFDADVERAVS
jgi:hypothetical protein